MVLSPRGGWPVGLSYQALNLLGGVLVLVNSFYHGAMPSVAVNVFWIAIAIFALSRVFMGKKGVEHGGAD